MILAPGLGLPKTVTGPDPKHTNAIIMPKKWTTKSKFGHGGILYRKRS